MQVIQLHYLIRMLFFFPTMFKSLVLGLYQLNAVLERLIPSLCCAWVLTFVSVLDGPLASIVHANANIIVLSKLVGPQSQRFGSLRKCNVRFTNRVDNGSLITDQQSSLFCVYSTQCFLFCLSERFVHMYVMCHLIDRDRSPAAMWLRLTGELSQWQWSTEQLQGS